MRQVKFKERPPPILPAEACPEYVRTPYPTQRLLEASSPAASTMSYERVYHPYQSNTPITNAFVKETKEFIRGTYPSGSTPGRNGKPKCVLNCSHSTLIVDDNWELRLRHPHYPHHRTSHFDGLERLAFARHIHIEFETGGPEIGEWDNIVKELQDSILSKYNILDAALEFTQLGGYGTISAWYPPKIDREKLRAFFENNGPDGLDSENSEWEKEEYGDELIITPMLRLTIIGDEDDECENREESDPETTPRRITRRE
ncbi:hypothetical protein GGR58DRAFT_356149 [Xylaria digitata]|nr:hypothetical protein GGR58DRAFT_356149 [Xylaria digitata]